MNLDMFLLKIVFMELRIECHCLWLGGDLLTREAWSYHEAFWIAAVTYTPQPSQVGRLRTYPTTVVGGLGGGVGGWPN